MPDAKSPSMSLLSCCVHAFDMTLISCHHDFLSFLRTATLKKEADAVLMFSLIFVPKNVIWLTSLFVSSLGKALEARVPTSWL